MLTMTRRKMMLLLSMTVATGLRPRAQERPKVDVYKDPTCGCCGNWVEHLRTQGFAATATDVTDLVAIKTKYNVPQQLRSCHTAVVDGYVIEGHVSAADIKRVLTERPAIAGLAVPGMPIGSPGMEGPNAKPYDVLAFDRQGRTHVFSTHGR